jgi:hypothetical protein
MYPEAAGYSILWLEATRVPNPQQQKDYRITTI